MALVDKHARAKRDLIEHYVYLAEHATVDVAERFLVRAEETFGDLARHPGMGSTVPVRSTRRELVRKWRVNDFENFLIFYCPRPRGVTIVRVLHAAQDWWRILGLV